MTYLEGKEQNNEIGSVNTEQDIQDEIIDFNEDIEAYLEDCEDVDS